MFLAAIFLAAFVRALASPVPVAIPSGPIPSPLCLVTAALSAGTCDPNRRRTIFDILYSCLGVIFLCTYISIHHNIPDQNDSWAKKTWLKLRTMLYAMVAPEVVIMWALRQRIMAGVIESWGKERGWTKTHGFFVQMGGLMLEGEEKESYVVVLWRDVIQGQMTPGLCVEDTKIEKIPKIRLKEIKDHGKGDLLAKLIVVLQTTWFVVQCIARRVEGLVLTELELVTLAFAALNAVTYILWWDKPLGVEYPIYFDLEGKRVDGPEEKEEEAWYKKFWKLVTRNWSGKDRGEEGVGLLRGSQESAEERRAVKSVWEDMIKRPFGIVFGPLLEMTNVEKAVRASSVHPFYAAQLLINQHQIAYLCASVIGVTFGGIHLIGWHFLFPTTTELWLWRASSLVLTVAPALIPFCWRPIADPPHDWGIPNIVEQLFAFLVTRIGTPLYVTARVIILIFSFFALRDLPDSAYDNIKWTNFIPHI
ncbi:hypothetical protein AX16_006381 [Volvariella volvacea WC 439]|nr:hypothetical protein AX16_006381 [Volvariella volvacea WC 439]